MQVDDLKVLHRVAYSRPGSGNEVKKNLRKFNGFPFTKEDKKYNLKLSNVERLVSESHIFICSCIPAYLPSIAPDHPFSHPLFPLYKVFVIFLCHPYYISIILNYWKTHKKKYIYMLITKDALHRLISVSLSKDFNVWDQEDAFDIGLGARWQQRRGCWEIDGLHAKSWR